MMLFAIFAVMTGLAVLFVLAPLRRGGGGARADASRALYREQLEAVDRDEAAGVVASAEADAARREIARRLMSDRGTDMAGRGAGTPARRLALALVVLVPAVALPLYLVLGEPDTPGAAGERQAAATPGGASVQELVAKVEAHLAQQPNDAQGWRVLAPVYFRLGRYEAAADAYRRALRLSGPDAEMQANLGEALVAARDGMVTAEARAAFEAARDLAPDAPKPRFFLAIATEQDGAWSEAADQWRSLLAASPEDAPWRPEVEQRLAAAEARGTGGGPTSEQVAAAQDMSEADRAEMIETMVSRLAERLEEDGDDLDGWLRLARAYIVLGRPDDARRAIAGAQENFPEESARIAETSRQLGIGS